MQAYLTSKIDLSSPGTASSCDELSLWSSYPGALLLDAITFKEDARILDIGFGTGFPLIEIAQRFGPSASVFGIDPWESATQRAKEKIDLMGIENISLLNGYAERLPFPDGHFDLIVSNMGLNNVADQLQVMKECFRTAKTGSQMVFTVNLPASMKEFYAVYKQSLLDLGLQAYLGKMLEHIKHKRKSFAENTDLIKKSGYTLNAVRKQNYTMKFLNGTAYLNHYFTKLAFLESWVTIVPEQNITEFFALLENRLNDVAKAHGCLELSIPLVCFDCKKP